MLSPSVSHSHQTSRGSSHNALSAELINYFNQNMLTDKIIKKSLDKVIEFWRRYERRWPVISAIAKDLLTPSVSTVASESAFSADKRVLSEVKS